MQYYSYRDVVPELDVAILPYTNAILSELQMQTVQTWQPWPEVSLVQRGQAGHASWTVLPLLHTFPGCDSSKSVWVHPYTSMLPLTTKLLHDVPNIRTALFSKMKAQTLLKPHQGWADLSNHVLRVHVPIDLPPPDDDDVPCTGIVVDGIVKHHVPGVPIVFDDSHDHFAFNRHLTNDRVVLIIDVTRPHWVAPGISTVPISEELANLASILG